jgi:ubiquinone/menaquinone biosynthesis C-methylase UbiE
MNDPAKIKLEDTGERLIADVHKNTIMYGEHMGRYKSVINAVSGKVVLDIASGSGYGSYELAKSASRVIGVDVDQDAIDYAKAKYKKSNLKFVKSDGLRIPLDDNSVDIVVSMETIEHIEDDEAFIAELHRVMKPSGLAVISTPNDRAYPKGNHFHYREYEKDKLVALIKSKFKNVKMYYQTIDLAASIISEDQLESEYEGSVLTARTIKRSAEDCVYFIAVASNSKLPENIIDKNVMLSELFSHLKEQQRVKDINLLNQIANSKKYKFIQRLASLIYFWKK